MALRSAIGHRSVKQFFQDFRVTFMIHEIDAIEFFNFSSKDKFAYSSGLFGLCVVADHDSKSLQSHGRGV